MRYRIVAVGKLRRNFYRLGCAHFTERLAGLAPVEVIEVRESRFADAGRSREEEAKLLLAQARGRIVALDERGQSFTSTELARHLGELEVRGESSLTVLVGGAEGLHPSVRAQAAESWSLSPLTFPHDLARLVLLEQLYRVESIRANHPYHRE